MTDKKYEQLRGLATAGDLNGSKTIRALICVANVVPTVTNSACCLQALLDVVEQMKGPLGMGIVGASSEDRKVEQVVCFITYAMSKCDARE